MIRWTSWLNSKTTTTNTTKLGVSYTVNKWLSSKEKDNFFSLKQKRGKGVSACRRKKWTWIFQLCCASKWTVKMEKKREKRTVQKRPKKYNKKPRNCESLCVIPCRQPNEDKTHVRLLESARAHWATTRMNNYKRVQSNVCQSEVSAL